MGDLVDLVEDLLDLVLGALMGLSANASGGSVGCPGWHPAALCLPQVLEQPSIADTLRGGGVDSRGGVGVVCAPRLSSRPNRRAPALGRREQGVSCQTSSPHTIAQFV